MITNKYIKEKYNLDNERKNKLEMKEIDLFNINTDKEGTIYSLSEFQIKLNQEIKRIDDKFKDVDFSIRIDDYGYDGAFEIKVLENLSVPETDQEVITRLKKDEKIEVKKLKEIEKAKKLLLENNIKL
jgi:hypothetical protein